MAKYYNYINMLVMPTDICNMNCIYCFHNEFHEKQGKMTEETLKKLYSITLPQYRQVNIIWHGGEPLVMGLDFFKNAISMQKEYPDCKVENRLQTNLTLMNQDYSEFFAKEKVGIGSSFDGLCNDSLRGNTDQILNGREVLLQNGNSCGFIMVVSRKNINMLVEDYRYFNAHNISYTINLYVDALEDKKEELSLDPFHTVERIKQLFHIWIEDPSCNIHIDYFERFLKYILYKEKRLCKYTSCLGKWVGIRYNGDIVPCNRYFPAEYGYGNVHDFQDIGEAFESEGFKRLLSEAICRREKCKGCAAFELCSGGCNNEALNEKGITENDGNGCFIFREIYLYIKKYMEAIIQERSVLDRIKNPQVQNLLNRKRNQCMN
ncbi:radical SAM protein [Lachnospiraceae bacterium MD1]|jgi:uncharacterized protein|uniref:Radical SAM protein n=1 Tax=Variimorphobacter saccharofermentans TaxID=2755051 RepID=A0A839JWM9_9FIRM|nr:radical SAM protein [Variimorphobacter saccharofermentans]MBB2182083.1 radical SAM protein [Variimorphobacter saccharofermentans]